MSKTKKPFFTWDDPEPNREHLTWFQTTERFNEAVLDIMNDEHPQHRWFH